MNRRKDFHVIVLAAQWLLCVFAVEATRERHGHSLLHCEQSWGHFVSSNIGSSSILPTSPLHDPEMEICYRGSKDTDTHTCCSRKMEKKYHTQSEKDFFDVIRSTSSYLKSLLTTNTGLYREQFMLMVKNSENNTETLFSEVFKIPIGEKGEPLHKLFTNIEQYLQGQQQIDIHKTVANFFDELFPLVFYNILNDPQSMELDLPYRECLKNSRQQLFPHPFGEVPNHLTHQLSKSLGTAHTFMESLNLAIEVVNTTDHLELETPCTRGLTRLRYCSHCQGYVQARPCRNFCYNVMRGCLATVAEIDRHWDSFVDSIKGLTMHMRGHYNLEETLNNLHTRIYEAILHAMETGHKFYSQVVDKCGHPKRTDESNSKSTAHIETKYASHRTSTKVMVYGRFDNFLRSLMASKGFYRSLADTVCSAEKYATGLDQNLCWNGENLGRYNKTLVDVDLEAQMKSNPEMKVADKETSSIAHVIDKLMHMKKQLQSKISLEMMQADDWSSTYSRKIGRRNKKGWESQLSYSDRDGSGSQRDMDRYDGHMDDEDYRNKGEGSGNGGRGKASRRRGYKHYPDGSGDWVEDDDGSADDDRYYDHKKYRPGKKSKHGGHNSDPDIYLEDEKPTRPSVEGTHNKQKLNHATATNTINSTLLFTSLILLLINSPIINWQIV